MAHVPLLINIGLALGYALLGGVLARKTGLPTIVGRCIDPARRRVVRC
jgi:hypothetical protein